MATSAKWEKFFMDAGIPVTYASEYAVIFSDNRMRIDMLNELNKEILSDIGIKVMGDVLSILRHSKKVFAQYERAKADEYGRKKAAEPPSKTDVPAKPAVVAKPVVAAKPVAVAKKEIPTLKSLPTATKTVPTIKPVSGRKTLSERFGQIESEASPPKKLKEEEGTVTVTLGGKVAKKTPKVAPQKQKVAVIPAQGQKITSTTNSSSVFDRLDKEKPINGGSSTAKITFGSLKPLKTTEEKSNSSIFSRLGSPSSPPPLSTTQGIFRRLGDRVSFSTVSSPFTSTPTGHTERSSSFPNFTVTKSDKSDLIRLGLSNSHSILRPVKPVKPVIRTGRLSMDSEPASVVSQTTPKMKLNKPKQGTGRLAMDTEPVSAVSQTTTPKTKLNKPKQGKSVFDRLGN